MECTCCAVACASPIPPSLCQDFHRRVVPSAGLDKVIVSDELARSLKEIVQFEKARYVHHLTLSPHSTLIH